MVRSDFIALLAKKYPQFRVTEVEAMFDVILNDIQTALIRGERVELRGFGTFSVKTRSPRKGRNPRTGERVDVPAKCVPYFRAGKDLRARVNDGVDPES